MIKCEVFLNSKCAKCGKMNFDMVRVGGFNMCRDCFVQEFGFVREFELDSDHGKKYHEWLEKEIMK